MSETITLKHYYSIKEFNDAVAPVLATSPVRCNLGLSRLNRENSYPMFKDSSYMATVSVNGEVKVVAFIADLLIIEVTADFRYQPFLFSVRQCT